MTIFTDVNIQNLFGVSDAENEKPERLKEYFFRNKAYENLANDLAIRILVGHKGSGKSALLKMLYLEDKEKNLPAIWLKPGDVLSAFDQKKGTVNSWIEDWKKTLLDVITNEVLQQIQPDWAKENISNTANTSGAILKYIKSKIDNVISGGSTAIQKDIVESFTKNNYVRIYIDDLDRGWEAKKEDIRRISTLLNAIRDICGASNSLQFRVGLRSDVYYLVRTSDESTDKIEDKIVWLTWSSQDLLVLFAKRIETFFGNHVDEYELIKKSQKQIASSFHRIMDETFSGDGKWKDAPIHRVLVSLQRNRPRDLVKLLGSAAKIAHSHNRQRISTQDLREIFASYSAERLQDIVNEFSSELPDIERLLLALKPTKKAKLASDLYLFTQDSLDKKLKLVMQQVPLRFTNGVNVTPRTIGKFLYKVDFIIARKTLQNDAIERVYFQDNRYLFDENTDFGFSWEIHPAYRWALQPDGLAAIFEQIDLERER